MRTKQMLITPITPEGQVSPAPILIRKSVIQQVWETLWEYIRTGLAVYGLIMFIWGLMS